MVNQERFGNPGSLEQRLKEIRREYSQAVLLEDQCAGDPLMQLDSWLHDAMRAELAEPNVMVLATVSKEGRPSARAVLLKELTSQGLTFYTNYLSRKARELEVNSFVSVAFVWEELERQVRVEGKVEKVSREQSEKYFAARPRAAQIAAHASHQSQALSSRAELERSVGEIEARFRDQPVPCPPHWGGYIIRPSRIEFWQGRESRLHDRLVFDLQENGFWKRTRLNP